MVVPLRRGRVRAAESLVALLLLSSLAGSAQARIRDRVTGERDFISGWRDRELSAQQMSMLLSELSTNDLDRVPETLFGTAYDKNLPDFVIYSASDQQPPRIALVKNHTHVNRVYGADYVWIMNLWQQEKPSKTFDVSDTVTVAKTGRGADANAVVVRTVETYKWPPEEDDAPDQDVLRGAVGNALDRDPVVQRKGLSTRHEVEIAQTSEEDSVFFRLEPLTYEPDIPERSILGSLVTLVGIGENKEEPAPEIEDVFISDAPSRLGDVPNTNRQLMLSMVKFRLRENSINRIRVVRHDRSVTATFGNFSTTSYGVSLGANAARFVDADEFGSHQLLIKPFVYFHLYLKRPRLPLFDRTSNMQFPGSVSFVLGTETNTDFEHWYTGVGFGHLLGRVGMTLGIPLRRITNASGKQIWVGGQSLGLFYTL